MKRFFVIFVFFAIGVVSGIGYVSLKDTQTKPTTILSKFSQTKSTPPIQQKRTNVKAVVSTPSKNQVKAYVAIVLDDWGYNTSALADLTHLSVPVTVAILPELPYSQAVAEAAIQSGHEVILHMPMEPLSHQDMEELTLLNDMDAQTLRRTLKQALASVPHVRGISNHTGSAFTANAEGMRVVLNEIAQSGLYFFDSMVTAETVGYQLAKEIHIPTAKRDIFLDNVREERAITLQLEALAKKALQEGSAIGIGHDEKITLQAIKKIIPSWNNRGIKCVTLGDLIQLRQVKSKVNQQFQSLVSDL